MNRRPHNIVWTPELTALLGTAPDRVIAERLGIRRETVVIRRVQAGIPMTRRTYPNTRSQQ